MKTQDLQKKIEGVRLDAGDRAEVLRYLAYRGQEIDGELAAQIDRCMETVNEAAAPRCILREFALEDGSALPTELAFLTGQDIRAHLRGCSRAFLLGATLGGAVDRLIQRQQIRNVADATIMDACGTALIEACCDVLEAEIAGIVQTENLRVTSRFSPGYGDLPIDVQATFVSLLDATRKIGLTVSASGILIPRKSVTAVLGVTTEEVREKTLSCEGCALVETCRFKKAGVSCGRKK